MMEWKTKRGIYRTMDSDATYGVEVVDLSEAEKKIADIEIVWMKMFDELMTDVQLQIYEVCKPVVGDGLHKVTVSGKDYRARHGPLPMLKMLVEKIAALEKESARLRAVIECAKEAVGKGWNPVWELEVADDKSDNSPTDNQRETKQC